MFYKKELINLILRWIGLFFPLQILPFELSFELIPKLVFYNILKCTYLLILLQALKLIVGSFCQVVYITYIVQNVYNLDFER